MRQIDITQRVQFTCDYLVRSDVGYSIQPCLYTVDVTVRSAQSVDGRVMEFAELQDLIRAVVPNNKFVVMLTDNKIQKLVVPLSDLGVDIEYVSFEVCAENLCSWIAEMLQGRLYLTHSNIYVVEVLLNENGTSIARWRK